MSAGWLATVAASISSLSNVVLPTCFSTIVVVRSPAVFVELDQEDLARPILVEGDRLRRAGVGVCHAAGLAALGGVPVTEGEVVEAARGDLVGRDDDLVAVGLARDRDRAVDHPDVPGHRGRFGGRRGDIVGDVGERAVRGALGREDPAVDDGVERGEVDRRDGPGRGP